MVRPLLKIFLPYTLLAGIGIAIWVSCNRPGIEPIVVGVDVASGAHDDSGGTSQATAARKTKRLVDPICYMDVNPAWGFEAQYKGESYFFCSERCRQRFAESPEDYLGDRCVVCKDLLQPAGVQTATYMGNTYRFCGEEHRSQFKSDPAAFFMHTMWGIPPWMYYGSIAFVLVVSFGLFEGIEWLFRARRTETALGQSVGAAAVATAGDRPTGASSIADRIDLLRLPLVRRLLTSRFFRFVCQAVLVGLFFLILAAGLFGSQNPALNIAPILTWTVWWGGLVVLIMFAGKAWCYVCPWDAVAGWMEKLRFWKKTDEGLGLDLPWPRMFRNILIATVLFVGLTWVELGFGVTMKPRMTAYLGIAMLLMAIVSAFLFRRKSFCRYGCLVGRVSGLYAMFSGIEIRPRKEGVCRSCADKPCVRGTQSAYGCPTFLYPGRLSENTYCIQCSECLQTCPEDNLAMNLRPWGTDLVSDHRWRADEAYLALLMLSITAFHGLSMTPNWRHLTEWLRDGLSLGHMLAFSLGMTLLMLGPIVIYGVLVAISYRLGASKLGGRRFTYHDYFVRYAYALLPIALFYHLAHNLEHLLMEGPKVVALASDPFGWRWDLFGTLNWNVPPLVSLDVLWILQILLVLVGHVYSLWVAGRTSSHVFGDRKRAFLSQIPLLLGMILFSVFSLWLLKQPMEMRTSAM
ncbi:MAG: YHS domain-containing protein [Planctomycetes bacterium]|nr:YHS domain-containing protein [Planctomycetota bacterium]